MTKEEKEVYREKGKQITIGVLDHIFILLLKTLITIVILVALFNWFGWIPVDNTDKDKWNRSEITLITDYGTGVQYLYKDGALIPRLDGDGKIIVIKK